MATGAARENLRPLSFGESDRLLFQSIQSWEVHIHRRTGTFGLRGKVTFLPDKFTNFSECVIVEIVQVGASPVFLFSPLIQKVECVNLNELQLKMANLIDLKGFRAPLAMLPGLSSFVMLK